MHLVRYRSSSGAPALGVRRVDGSIAALPFESLAEALRRPAGDLRAAVEAAGSADGTAGSPDLLPPADGRMEVWASGVTYRRSREARMEESQTSDIYWRVYEAERPELFLKAAPWRLVTDGEPIGVRADSPVNVPEPELAVVANAYGEIVGYTVSNDVSSRSIEGENPLYLPQAKVYAGACALAPGVRPAWEVADPTRLTITCAVRRDGAVAWSGETSTSEMRRDPQDLVSWLYRQDTYPDGVVLSTGTGLVPDLDFTLLPGDVVTISIGDVGTLSNTVHIGVEPFAWLTGR